MSDPTTDPDRLPPALADYAARLLIGTGLDPREVASVAAGRLPGEGGAAAALRDGWQAATRQAAKR